jgi:dTDP-4-amino-4,6-dideoxygalactose transaminase
MEAVRNPKVKPGGAGSRPASGRGAAPVPFNDPAIQWREIADDVRAEYDELFARSAFSHGPYVEHFEREIAEYLGVPHAIAVNSGTSALHLAVVAAGIRPGDEVLVPAHTFIATLWGAIYAGATPVLCDVEEATGNIDVSDAARRISTRTRAIIPVHLYGQPAAMADVCALAETHDLVVIEDAAQAVGARWRGRAAGAIGNFGCFSFYPGKNLGAAGEGGLVTTHVDAHAKRLRALRNHGQSERYVHGEIGYNYRMDGLQAVVLRHKLRHLDRWTARRRELAAFYGQALSNLPLVLPEVRHDDHVWHLFVVRTSHRDALRDWLAAAGIETGLHYPVPNHRQPCLQHLAMERQSFPTSENWATQGLSLPLFYGMTDAQLRRVVDTVHEFFAAIDGGV